MKNLIQPLVLSCLALLDLSSASAILTARAGPPRAFEVRDFSTLTNNLLAVVDSNATAPLTTRDVTSTYTDAINSNAPALNNLFAQSTVSGIAAEFRASLTCGAATLVFGNKIVINSNSANYTVEEDEPWSVTVIPSLELLLLDDANIRFTHTGIRMHGRLRHALSNQRALLRLLLLLAS